MAEQKPVPILEKEFRQADQGFHFNLDRNIGAILDDMAIGYAQALGHERNMSSILEHHPENQP